MWPVKITHVGDSKASQGGNECNFTRFIRSPTEKAFNLSFFPFFHFSIFHFCDALLFRCL